MDPNTDSPCVEHKWYHGRSLFVADIHKEVTEEELCELFSRVGSVHSVRICRDSVTRHSLGYAYVNYTADVSLDVTKQAVDELNYTVLRGFPIRVMWSLRDARARNRLFSGAGNVFVKNIPCEVGPRVIHDLFSAYGPILSCKVAMDEAGKFKGFGFVSFETESSAEAAITELHGQELEGKPLYVGHFVSKNQGEGLFTNVYVKPLTSDIDETRLKEMFSEFGNLKSAVVMRDENGKSKGFGFVNFEKPQEAQIAVERMNGVDHAGSELYVGRAQKKPERRALLMEKFQDDYQSQIGNNRRGPGTRARPVDDMFIPTDLPGVKVIVEKLSKDVTELNLCKAFQRYGDVLAAKVVKGKAGESSTYGVVAFARPMQAQTAIRHMDGAAVFGCRIRVSAVKPTGSGSMEPIEEFGMGRGPLRETQGHFWPNYPGYPMMGMNMGMAGPPVPPPPPNGWPYMHQGEYGPPKSRKKTRPRRRQPPN